MAPPITDYCTAEDLASYGISENALEPIDGERKAKAIAGASRFIDSYLRKWFTLPLVQVGADIARACAIIAVYDLMAVEGYQPSDPEDDPLKRRYKEIVDWLKMVAAGTVTPDVTGSAPGSEEGMPSTGARVLSSSQRGWSSRGTGRTNGGFEGD